MIVEGLKLAVLGMGIVYLFLILVVISIKISSRLLAPITQKEIEMEAAQATAGRKGGKRPVNNDPLIAVISAAIKMFKKNK